MTIYELEKGRVLMKEIETLENFVKFAKSGDGNVYITNISAREKKTWWRRKQRKVDIVLFPRNDKALYCDRELACEVLEVVERKYKQLKEEFNNLGRKREYEK